MIPIPSLQKSRCSTNLVRATTTRHCRCSHHPLPLFRARLFVEDTAVCANRTGISTPKIRRDMANITTDAQNPSRWLGIAFEGKANEGYRIVADEYEASARFGHRSTTHASGIPSFRTLNWIVASSVLPSSARCELRNERREGCRNRISPTEAIGSIRVDRLRAI
jgi:hypothetical protein